MPAHRVTLRDIAAATGFHFTTVGEALRPGKRLPAATIRVIRDVATRMGYRPSPLLSALSSFHARPQGRLVGVIGFLCTYDHRSAQGAGPRAQRLFRAASALADAKGFKLEAIRVNLQEPKADHVAAVLRARSIQGLILAPLMPHAGPFMNLPWDRFSVVGIGYSITNLRMHRVCFSHFQGMLLHLRSLRARGYRRIGLAISEEVNVRTGGNLMGAYLSEQHANGASSRIEPCILSGLDSDRIKCLRWIRRERIECIIADGARPYDWLRDDGYRLPEDIGIALTSRDGDETPIAGIDEQDAHLGQAAVDFAISLLRSDERGLPQHPRYAMVESRWVYKPTVREIREDRQPAASADGGTRFAPEPALR